MLHKSGLRVEEVSLSFGEVQAVTGVSFEVKSGEIVAIIGPNEPVEKVPKWQF